MFDILSEEEFAIVDNLVLTPDFMEERNTLCEAQRAKTAWEMIDFLQAEAHKPDGLIQALVNVVKVHVEFAGIERPK